MRPVVGLRALSGAALTGALALAVAPRRLPGLDAAGDPSAPATAVTTFGLQVVATGFAAYVSLVLLAVAASRSRRVPETLRRLVGRWTSRGLAASVRRLVGASALAMGVLPLAPAGAAANEAPPVLAPADLVTGPAPRLDPTPADPLPDDPPPSPAAAVSVTVRPGDSFWTIARQQTRDRLGRTPSDDEVVEPWLALIAANRDRLADPSDPDLIFPGQVLRLPDHGSGT